MSWLCVCCSGPSRGLVVRSWGLVRRAVVLLCLARRFGENAVDSMDGENGNACMWSKQLVLVSEAGRVGRSGAGEAGQQFEVGCWLSPNQTRGRSHQTPAARHEPSLESQYLFPFTYTAAPTTASSTACTIFNAPHPSY
jgi:hypothetical protein